MIRGKKSREKNTNHNQTLSCTNLFTWIALNLFVTFLPDFRPASLSRSLYFFTPYVLCAPFFGISLNIQRLQQFIHIFTMLFSVFVGALSSIYERTKLSPILLITPNNSEIYVTRMNEFIDFSPQIVPSHTVWVMWAIATTQILFKSFQIQRIPNDNL